MASYRCSVCGEYANTVHLPPAFGGRHDLAVAEDYVVLCRSDHGSIDAPRSQRRQQDEGEDFIVG